MKIQNSTRHYCRTILTALGLTLIAAVNARADYKSVVLGDNPLAFYAVNPGSDPFEDSPDLTANGNDGFATGITPVAGPSAYITNAAAFNPNTPSFIYLGQGSNPALLNYAGPITMEAWAQPANTTESPADILAKGYDSTLQLEIALRANGGNYYGGSYSNGNSYDATGGQQTTNWTYLVSTYDGTNWNLYVNNVLVQQNAASTGSINFSDGWYIGAGNASRFFAGNISEVALYNYALSAAQVQAHYFEGWSGTTNLSSNVPIILIQPQSQTTFTGGHVTFNVTALSQLPATNQWFKNSTPLTGQTNTSLTLNNVQASDATNYSVVIGNSNGTTNSVTVSLTLTPPVNLEWNGANGSTWDTGTNANWVNLANSQQVVFETSDLVLFDDTPGVPTSISIAGTVSAGITTINSSTNNFSFSGNGFTGSGSLIKEGTSTLNFDSQGGFTGPVTIGGGTLVAGNNALDAAASFVISNGATLDFAGSVITGNQPVTVSGTGVNGEGAIYNSYADYPVQVVDVNMAADTKFGGSARWDLGSGAQINGPHNLTVDMSAAGNYVQWNSITIGANVLGVIITNATSLGTEGMDNSCQNPATLFTFGNNCNLTMYGGGFNGSFVTPATVTIYNANLNFSGTTIHILSGGVVDIYAQNETFSGSSLIFENNTQWITYYNAGDNTIDNAVTLNGLVHWVIGNHNMVYTNLVSGVGGFVLDYYDHAAVFSVSNTYSGPTIIGSSGNSPYVALTGSGSITHSSPIFFGGSDPTVVHVDASGRPDQTFTLASGQTLGGVGLINGSLVVSPGATLSPAGTNTTLSITTGTNSTGTIAATNGNITLVGTTVIKLNGSGVSDQVQTSGTLTYGGTLSLVNISGSPLAAGNSFQIFSAGTIINNSFTITPATPGAGLTWDTSHLSTGSLNVLGTAAPVISSVTASGGSLVFSGTGGMANGNYAVLATTNLTTPLTNWTVLSTSNFDNSGAFHSTNAISAGVPAQFYTIKQLP